MSGSVRQLPWLPLVTGGVLLGALSPALLRLVELWGHFIPQPDLQADYVTGVVWAVALGALFLVWPVSSGDRWALLLLWGAKCFVTLGFMLFYENSYNLDAYAYFETATEHSFPWEEVGFGSGTHNVAALSWIQSHLLGASYHAIKVSYAWIGLLAVYVLYCAGVLFVGREDRRVLYGLGLFPSILFWSSILGKDPLILLGIACYVRGVVGWSRLRNARSLLWIGGGVLLAAMIRLWLGPILLLPLVVFALRGIRGVFARAAFVALVLLALAATLSEFREMFGLETMQDIYSTTDTVSQSWAEGGSGQQAQVRFTGLGSMVRFLPIGAFTALFRPLPGEILNPFGLLAGVENLLLLALVATAVRRTRLRTLGEPLIQWAMVLIVTWASIYGFVSYQNLGTAVRFRLQILPVLLGLLLHLAYSREGAGGETISEASPIR